MFYSLGEFWHITVEKVISALTSTENYEFMNFQTMATRT